MKPDTTEIAQLWIDIEDHLIPFLKLDAHLRSVYYHLVRRARVVGQPTVKVSIDSLAQATGLSTQVRQHIRTLEAKGALKIVSRDRTGTTIEVYIPSEIPGCVKTKVITNGFNLETYDFYANPMGRRAIIEREGGRCFYCLRGINSDSAVLDHAVGQLVRLDNSYKNIVACCHECNSLKSGMAADDFIRELYRRGRLNAAEMESRLSALGALQRGEVKPITLTLQASERT